MSAQESPKAQPVAVIIGGGPAGLTLALSLKKKLGIIPVIYEQAPKFDDEAGGAIGIYPNGLRVFRDIDRNLLQRIRDVGQPFICRRWMRHDGSEIAVAEEKYLCSWDSEQDARERASLGIRRWRLQKVLLEAVLAENIPVHFGHRLKELCNIDNNERVRCVFDSGVVHVADMVFGCDGVKSVTRAHLFGKEFPDPPYTGLTILMGASDIPRSKPGICFPSSNTTHVHAVFYPTGPKEQVFQFYFPSPEKPETWRPLSEEEGAKECLELAAKLRADGWDQQFIEPLMNAKNVLRVGLRARDPLPRWYKHRIVLLGDAAHPPVPFIGQGAMMAIEDAGVMSVLLKRLCMTPKGFSFEHFPTAMKLYEQLRIPRTTKLYRSSHALGRMQQLRANSNRDLRSMWETLKEEWYIWSQVKMFGTLPVMQVGSSFDCQAEAEAAASRVGLHAYSKL